MRSGISILTVLATLLVALGHLPAPSAAQVASPQGKDWAVVIGINNYKNVTPLQYAINDATAVGDLLAQQGFAVTRLVSPSDTTRQSIETVLGTELPKRLGSNDRVLVFFSGHGQDDPNSEGTKMGYLLPIEANPENLAATAISMGRVREWANFWRAKHVLFIVDSCYSGIIGENAKSIRAVTPQFLKQVTREKARQLIVAGEADQEALEIAQWGQSLLTHFLLEGLGKNKSADQDSDGVILASELYNYLQRRVYDEAMASNGREQRPRQYSLSGDKGEFWFPGLAEQQQPVQPVRIPTLSVSGVPSPAMIRVEPGSYMMGGNHNVHITKPFAIARYETTFDEYDAFAQATGRSFPNDRNWGRGSRPVIGVSWNDARDYARWLSRKTGKRYRLPTEAEWEYASRSGGQDQKWAGTSNESQLKGYAVYDKKEGPTEPVGSKLPNGLGLHDMSGNVYEWVEDCWDEDYSTTPTDGSARSVCEKDEDLRRLGFGNEHTLRGGMYWSTPCSLRTFGLVMCDHDLPYRLGWNKEDHTFKNPGFRLAQDLP